MVLMQRRYEVGISEQIVVKEKNHVDNRIESSEYPWLKEKVCSVKPKLAELIICSLFTDQLMLLSQSTLY